MLNKYANLIREKISMDKLKMQTKNKADENFKKLAELFPNAVTETIVDGEVVRAIDKDVLMQEISTKVVEGREERYQFTWPDKKKAILKANSPINKTLRPCREESVDFDNTKNLYIEGDNLEVLKLLQETYLGEIKMIYIDPPYNTGSDFIYKDSYTMGSEEWNDISGDYDEEGNMLVKNLEGEGRFHTNWLNMIYPRLKLAKDLLSDEGVIFISIDDNEVANLKKICDEIFGIQNFVAFITIIVKTEGRRYGGFAKTHEQVLVYSKDIEKLTLNEIEIEGKKFQYKDKNGGFNVQELRNQNARAFNSMNRPNLRYPFYVDLKNIDNNGFCKVYLENTGDLTEVYPIVVNGYESVWRWGKNEKAKKYLDELVARKGKDGVIRIYQKMRKLSEIPKTVLMDKEFISIKGTKELQGLLGVGIFDFPKPSKLIKLLTEIATDKECYVLDFFSGSATTAHAVMQLNAEDGGKRKFIMVQLPEKTDEKSEAYKTGYKNICEIGKERIRRAGKKIKEESPLTTQDLDTGFRVLKLDESNMKDVYYTPEEMNIDLFDTAIDNIKEDRTPEDLLFQVMLELGILLSSKIECEVLRVESGVEYTCYNVADGYLIACFDDNVTEEVITKIAKRKPYYFVMKDSSMANDSVAANFEQIFETYSKETIRKVL